MYNTKVSPRKEDRNKRTGDRERENASKREGKSGVNGKRAGDIKK